MTTFKNFNELIKEITKGFYNEQETKKLQPLPSIFSLEKDLQLKKLEYLKNHQELVCSQPGIKEIFGPLVTEGEYTRCLAWILSPENTEIIGLWLLTKVLISTYKEYNKNLIVEIMDKDYLVLPEYRAECGKLDIFIRSKNSRKFMVVIENKIFPENLESPKSFSIINKEQYLGQLQKYAEWAKQQEFQHTFLLFLCRDFSQMLCYETAFRPLKWNTILENLKLLQSQLIISPKFISLMIDLFMRDLERLLLP
ncbi:MAG: PD-(D/E)XK nuclease family protein [Thermodesulfobacteriota bacterium]